MFHVKHLSKQSKGVKKMQTVPKANRIHIAIFGKRNAGKSSLINALTNQSVALVSEVAGTTTDPVYKAMEILPLGPVMMIDTAGLDDEGALGQLRIERTIQVLNKTDLAIVVIDGNQGISEFDQNIIREIKKRNIPIVGAINKIDKANQAIESMEAWQSLLNIDLVPVSTITRAGIELLKGLIIKNAPQDWEEKSIIGDLIREKDQVILVAPIDNAAPKGRLILPQVQTIRDILDHGGMCCVVKETELADCLATLKEKPIMVVTDSQAFAKVAAITPPDIRLTSFSMLFARYKGDLSAYLDGVKAIAQLAPGDKVLIAEGCTHHRQTDDIGTVKIPKWLDAKVGGALAYEWTSGGGFPKNLRQYKLIIHCGACMLNRREVLYRLSSASEAKVPVINYGILIAYLNGILTRTLAPFPEAQALLKEIEQQDCTCNGAL